MVIEQGKFKMGTVIDKETFNRKISLLTSKLNNEDIGQVLWLAHYFVAQRPGHLQNWSRGIQRALRCCAGGQLRSKNFSDNVTDEGVLELTGENRTLLKNVLRRKVN